MDRKFYLVYPDDESKAAVVLADSETHARASVPWSSSGGYGAGTVIELDPDDPRLNGFVIVGRVRSPEALANDIDG